MSVRSYSLMAETLRLEAPDLQEIANGMPYRDDHFPYPRADDPSLALRRANPQALGEVLAHPGLTAWTLRYNLGEQKLAALAGLIRVTDEWPRAFSYAFHPCNADVVQRRIALVGVVNHAFGEGAEAVQMLVHPSDRNGNKVAEGAGFRIMEPAGQEGFDQLVLPSPTSPLSAEELGGIDRQAAIATYLGVLDLALIRPLDISS